MSGADTELHVFTLPELCQVNAKWTQTPTVGDPRNIELPRTVDTDTAWTCREAGILAPGGTANALFGLVNWVSGTNGSRTIPIPASDNGLTPPSQSVLPGQVQGSTNYSSYCKSRVRVVGLGIEVANTSPEINLSGSVTSYRLDYKEETVVRNYTTITSGGFGAVLPLTTSVPTYRCPPQSQYMAMLPPDSVTWPAKEGVYITVPVYEDDGGYCEYTPRALKLSDQSSGGDNIMTLTTKSLVPDDVNGLPLINRTTATCMRRANVGCCGAYFTGLSAGNTFNIKVRVYLEVFPSTQDELFPLSCRSPPYDPALLALISRTYASLPVAVPLKYNISTKWWGMVLGSVGKAGMVASGFAGPYAPAVRAASTFMVGAGAAMGMAKTKPAPITNGVQEVNTAASAQSATNSASGTAQAAVKAANDAARAMAKAWGRAHASDRKPSTRSFKGATVVYSVTAGSGVWSVLHTP